MATHCQTSGYFKGGVKLGEFTKPPDGGLAAAIWMLNSGVYRVYANGGTAEFYNVRLRIYRNAFAEDAFMNEWEMAKAVNETLDNLLTDADLNSTVMSIDPGGISGNTVTTEWGYTEINNVMFRIADITLPILVDDSITVSG